MGYAPLGSAALAAPSPMGVVEGGPKIGPCQVPPAELSWEGPGMPAGCW